MVGVILVAPSPALRAGLRSLLASDPGIRVVAERSRWSGAADDALDEVDVVITTSTSFASGADGDWGDPAVLPVLFLADQPLVPQAIPRGLGVWGVLPLDSSAGELCAAVRALAEGLAVGAPQLLFGERQATDGGPLTERETEVLEWLARGLANKQIAAQLGISEHTVKFHITSIYAKLNATNRTQAVREGLRNGWILL